MTPQEALAAALPARLFVALLPEEREYEREDIAAAILDALDRDGWVLVKAAPSAACHACSVCGATCREPMRCPNG